ncbi:MAG: Flp pilus assembly protein CpaB [Sulfuricella sp.]|nr:Flp pilus assembly protein CpaB [Sulfuricella sp.]
MKNPRAVMMIVVSVLIGFAAVIMAMRWISQQASVATNKVVVAAVDIQLGSRLNPEMLKLTDWPRGSMPPGAVNDPKELDTRVLKTSVLRGEPVLESKLAPLGTKGGLSAVVAEGKRAMTVRVNDVIGVAGFALPGNYVDILVSTEADRGKGGGSTEDKKISKIVLEHILVLAVAQEAGRDETKPRVVSAVTLEVTPEEAENLDLARSIGQLSLVLRNQIDKMPVGTEGAMKVSLLKRAPEPETKPEKQAAPKRAPARHVKQALPKDKDRVQVIKGVQESSVVF